MSGQLVALSILLLVASLPGRALAAEDAAPSVAPREGDVISFDRISELRPFLPVEFWRNRDFFFYEGMQLEIGPPQRDYAPPAVYQAATAKYAEAVRLGPENSLENYRAGQPFPVDAIDCAGDPDAGAKLAWNFVRRWDGSGGKARFYYSYWDRGEELPLYYEGHSAGAALAFRPEPEYDATGGDLFRAESRYTAGGPKVEAPFDARGIEVLTYRYKASFGPKATTRNDDTWVYVPTLRRVRRISSAQRTDAVSGTDFTFDDLFSFNGIVPQYRWECLGEQQVLAPVNSKVKAFPYERDHNFGPYGLSYADDRWELRRAIKFRFIPREASHPYHHKDLYVDRETFEPLYSFAYDHKEELWKIIWHNHRWSEEPDYTEYPGWEGVPEPRDLTVVSDVIVNAQTGTGNRIEFWDRSGTAIKKNRVRRLIDVGGLVRNH